MAHDTAILRNPPIHGFMGQRRNLNDPQQTSTSAVFLGVRKEKQLLFCGHNIWTEGVLV